MIARGCYVILAVLVILITGAGAFCHIVVDLLDQPTAAYYAFGFDTDAAVPMIGRTWPEASEQGIGVGDRIAGIDGVPLGPRDTVFEAGNRLRQAGSVLTLDLVDKSGRVTRHQLRRVANISNRTDRDSGLTIFESGAFTVFDSVWDFLFFASLSLLLYRRRPRDPEAMLLAFGFIWFSLDPGYSPLLFELGLGALWPPLIWCALASGAIGFFCMLTGVCAFPDGRFVTRWSRLAWLVPAANLMAILGSGLSILQFPTFRAVAVIAYAIPVTSLVLRYFITPPGIERQQLKIATFGGVVMVLAGVGTLASTIWPIDWRPPLTTYFFIRYVLGSLQATAFPLALLLSLLRYRLYDADRVIRRSAGVAALSLSLVAVFACTEQLAQSLGQDYLGNDLGEFAGGLGAAAAAVMIAPLHRRIGEWAERRFQAQLTGLRRDLPLLVGDLRETATPAMLAQTVLDRIDGGLHARHGAIIGSGLLLAAHNIEEGVVGEWLARWKPRPSKAEIDSDRLDPLFPLRVPLRADGAGLVGWLLLGPQPDGSLYGKDEREVLATIADPVARALSTSAERQTRETEQSAQTVAIAREVAILRTELQALRELVMRRDERLT